MFSVFIHAYAIRTSNAEEDFHEQCFDGTCYITPKLKSGRQYKVKSDATQWCKNKSSSLALVKSQREQDDIDTFWFSLPQTERRHSALFIDYKGERSEEGYICWSNENPAMTG